MTSQIRYSNDLIRIIATVNNERRKIESAMPVMYKKLKTILDEGPNNAYIILSSGDRHYFEWEEIVSLAEITPWYIAYYVELPFVFRYYRTSWQAVFELTNNIKWNSKALGLIFDGKISKERRKLSMNEMRFLLKKFRSITFISLDFSF